MTYKCWKEMRFCKTCGARFEVKHRLRLHCDECIAKTRPKRKRKKK